MVFAVLLVQLDAPAGALDQGGHPGGRNVVLRPPGSDQAAVADAQIDLRRPCRSHRITGQDRSRHDQLSEPGEQPPGAIPGTAEAQVPAQQQDRSPAPVPRRIVHIAEANVSYPPAPAHLCSTWRGIDSGNGQPPLLQVQGSAARASAEIQDRPLRDKRQDFPLLPVPLLKTPEKPFRMHGRPRPATPVLQNKLRHILALQIVEQSSPEGVLRRIDHRPIFAHRIRHDAELSLPMRCEPRTTWEATTSATRGARGAGVGLDRSVWVAIGRIRTTRITQRARGL